LQARTGASFFRSAHLIVPFEPTQAAASTVLPGISVLLLFVWAILRVGARARQAAEIRAKHDAARA
jgi:hypothetical protein